MNKERKEGGGDNAPVDKKRLAERERKLGIQMKILTDPLVDPQAQDSFRKLSAGDTSEEERIFYTNLQNKSALETSDRVQEFMDNVEAIDQEELYVGDHIEEFSVSKKELRPIIEDLRSKLLAEASRAEAQS